MPSDRQFNHPVDHVHPVNTDSLRPNSKARGSYPFHISDSYTADKMTAATSNLCGRSSVDTDEICDPRNEGQIVLRMLIRFTVAVSCMNSGLHAALWSAIFLFCAVTASAAKPHSDGTARYPNVIFMLTDDLGYSDIGCYGARKVKTPHIDRLAAEGIRFTDFHTAASICSPSRAAF